ncbi:MAG: hypothetical protein Q8Q31_05020 [Nanoarchaeota archaeon]|nr:hypothetical protein [Nanoarchaeota archaeon]
MGKREVSPVNEEHFLRLIEFCKEIIQICLRNGVIPIIHGSFASFYYIKDRNIKVNDIDLLIPENSYKMLIRGLKKNKIEYTYVPKWHTLIIKRGDPRVELDSKDFHYFDRERNKELPGDFKDLDFYGMKIKMLSFDSLLAFYKLAYNRSIEDKEKLFKKIKRLEKLKKIDLVMPEMAHISSH